MRRISRRMPTPSMAVAFVALLAALGGTAAALPGSNTVTSGDIKRGAVGSSDIKNNSVRSGDIRNSTVRGRDVRNNTLTGNDINESSLGIVPAANAANAANVANSANNAQTVDGQSIAKFKYDAVQDSAPRTVLNFGGLTLTANCDGGTLAVLANSTTSDGFLHSHDSQDNNRDSDELNPGDDDNLFATNGGDSSQGTLTYASAGGNIVTVTFAGEETGGTPNNPDCSFYGTAVGS